MSRERSTTWSGRGRRPKALGPQTHKTCSICGFMKERGAFNLRKNGKTLQSRCRECASNEGCAKAKRNPERYAEYAKKWRDNNPARSRELARLQRLNNIEHARKLERNKYYRNQEAILVRRRQYYYANREKSAAEFRQWRLQNRDWLCHKRRLYEARRRLACPTWADCEKIKAIYQMRQKRSHEEGIEYHVDHIVPLKSDIVCGLHVPWNLEIIPAPVNQSKSNRTWPDMP